jgi:hypothetical protein
MVSHPYRNRRKKTRISINVPNEIRSREGVHLKKSEFGIFINTAVLPMDINPVNEKHCHFYISEKANRTQLRQKVTERLASQSQSN